MQSEAPEPSPKKPPRYQGPRHPFDRRSRNAKRYGQLVEQFTTEAGTVTEAKRATIEQLVGVVMQSETMTASIVNGKAVDPEDQVRLATTRARLMRELGIGQGRQAPRQSFPVGDLGGSNDNYPDAARRSAIG